MFNRAVTLMNLSRGLGEKIRVCTATYTARFGVRLRGGITGYQTICDDVHALRTAACLVSIGAAIARRGCE